MTAPSKVPSRKPPTTPREKGPAVRARTSNGPPKARPGRQPEKPLVVLYEEGSHTVCAMLVHPGRVETRIESARGKYAALGILMDAGYSFGPIKERVPDWAKQRVPQHCHVLGSASITGVPFV